jgi:hypothetical protein
VEVRQPRGAAPRGPCACTSTSLRHTSRTEPAKATLRYMHTDRAKRGAIDALSVHALMRTPLAARARIFNGRG